MINLFFTYYKMIKESKKLPIWLFFVLISGIILIGLFFNYKLSQNTGTENFLIFD
jgi:hypothetical protein